MCQLININSGFTQLEQLNSEHHGAQSDYVLTLVTAGFVTYHAQQTVQVKPGMVCLVPSGTQHQIMQGSNLSVHWLGFSLSSGLKEAQQPLLKAFSAVRNGALPIMKLDTARVGWITQLFCELEVALQNSQPNHVLQSLAVLILHEVNNGLKLSNHDYSPNAKVKKALSIIQCDSHRGITLKDVALKVHSNPTYLANLMKQTTGLTVGEWIKRYQLKTAKQLLLHSNQRVEDIAEQAGWNDVTHFIRQFKRAYNLTPAKWRKQNR
ncbi:MULTISPECIES: AraC family transcriptional regulator [unclassified Pseudoalteromonas]|uniref:AraC family transcriptional regulator n=1 Tax=unclassified Pseudoalteromonas TaxID=194690 RepID=UPI0030143EF1